MGRVLRFTRPINYLGLPTLTLPIPRGSGLPNGIQLIGRPYSEAQLFAIGQAYDGTALPFLWGTAACATIAFVLTVLTEPRRLFAGPLGPERCEHIPEDLG